jgi:hypothetical protein
MAVQFQSPHTTSEVSNLEKPVGTPVLRLEPAVTRPANRGFIVSLAGHFVEETVVDETCGHDVFHKLYSQRRTLFTKRGLVHRALLVK